MTKMLSRDEIDKLLDRDKMGRTATHEEIMILQKAIGKRKTELGMMLNEKLSKPALEKIISELGFEDIEIMLV